MLTMIGCATIDSEYKATGHRPEDALSAVSTCPVQLSKQSLKHTTAALQQSLRYFQQQKERRFQFGPDQFSRKSLVSLYEELLQMLQKKESITTIQTFLCQNAVFYKSTAPRVLFTGYFEPTVMASLTKSDRFRFPVYRRPDDLIRVPLQELPLFQKEKYHDAIPQLRGRIENGSLMPYYTRHEIDIEKKLQGRGLELAWAEDPVDLFFLHIQGSGSFILDDGRQLRLGYADKNGHPYRAIGKLLVDQGKMPLKQVSMQSLKNYLYAHPSEMYRIFNYNPSYVFFRKLDTQGPVGSLGQTLTPMGSIASDSSLFPKGALAFIQLTVPTPHPNKDVIEKSLLVLNQDTGGAIRGAGRVDLFTGAGEDAAALAGNLRSYGSLYFIAPNRNLVDNSP